jgi:hypothetical protein
VRLQASARVAMPAGGRAGEGVGGGGGLQRGPGRGSPEVAASSPVKGWWVNRMVETREDGDKYDFSFLKIGLTGGPRPHHQIGLFKNTKNCNWVDTWDPMPR